MKKPIEKPKRPNFSSGPCAKRPDWSAANLATQSLGRSHRSDVGKARLRSVIERTRRILGVPDDYRIGIVPASDTGAFELAMWNLLGARPVTALVWESFGQGWATDLQNHLKLDAQVMQAPYGALPDLSQVDPSHDVLFTWNGTTSGVRVPDGDWIAENRAGLTLCDATSAAYAQDLPWSKLDVVTYSWQKALGGEAQHGMLILSPRAVSRLEDYAPPWPLPKIFRLTKDGKLNEGIFAGATINTPSMLCVEDHLDALTWAESIGGLAALIKRSDQSLRVIAQWVEHSPWAAFLAHAPKTRSNTSVCLSIVDDRFVALTESAQRALIKRLEVNLGNEQVAYDFGSYRDAPPGLRIWCGATVDPDDVALLLPWLDWAFGQEINLL